MRSKLTQKDAQSVFEHYAFYNGNIEEFMPLSRSMINSIARVKTSGFNITFKRYTSTRQTDRIELTHTSILALEKANYPVPQIILNKNGDTVTTTDRGRFVLMNWVEGEHLSLESDPQLLRKGVEDVGYALSQFHQLGTQLIKTDHISDNSILYPTSLLNSSVGDGNIVWKSTWRAKLFFKRKKNTLDKWVLSNISDIKKHTEKIAESVSPDDKTLNEMVPIHGDISWNNIIFKDGNISGIIDWDNLIIAPRIYDIGIALRICGKNIDLIQDFLHHYNQHSGFKFQKKLLTGMMKLNYIKTIRWHLNGFYTKQITDMELVEHTCREALETLNWLDNNQDRIMAE